MDGAVDPESDGVALKRPHVLYDRTPALYGAECGYYLGDEGWEDHRAGKPQGTDPEEGAVLFAVFETV